MFRVKVLRMTIAGTIRPFAWIPGIIHLDLDHYTGTSDSVAVEVGLKIALLVCQGLSVKLFNLVCREWPWSSFPSFLVSLIFKSVSLSLLT